MSAAIIVILTLCHLAGGTEKECSRPGDKKIELRRFAFCRHSPLIEDLQPGSILGEEAQYLFSKRLTDQFNDFVDIDKIWDDAEKASGADADYRSRLRELRETLEHFCKRNSCQHVPDGPFRKVVGTNEALIIRDYVLQIYRDHKDPKNKGIWSLGEVREIREMLAIANHVCDEKDCKTAPRMPKIKFK